MCVCVCVCVYLVYSNMRINNWRKMSACCADFLRRPGGQKNSIYAHAHIQYMHAHAHHDAQTVEEQGTERRSLSSARVYLVWAAFWPQSFGASLSARTCIPGYCSLVMHTRSVSRLNFYSVVFCPRIALGTGTLLFASASSQ